MTIYNTKGILDYVHSYVRGASMGGKHYFINFLDDFFKITWVYTLRSKSDVFNVFLKWKKMVETQIG